ncbi:hypothetical protein ISF_06749 [Cordyceps fumosorosea ARSEF 2679]|uniref:Uncharacterized protein n=1 Tax=Cordyceps fumosorosea (strain ARSEF 2679) TaxID=1081104 RepID=A0A167R2F3_CORFA|nr:hypothetical protein ISF_06749 [Cordyceps fumosorosea ARSEF 2679]OAA58210.1 hypothetical protein ISF_06749 [Cordyceps fumosorosea ARSEF 2679]
MADSDMAGIAAAFRKRESSADPNLAEAVYRAAILVEEATVSELLPGLSSQSNEWTEHAHRLQLALGCLADAKDDNDPPPPPFAHGHFITRPSPWFANCRSCQLSAKMRVAYTSHLTARLHLLTQHRLQDNNTI